MKHFVLSFCLLLCVLASATCANAGSLRQVRFQLKWEHQFQFAGYYAARELGYYREIGLDVELIPANPRMKPMLEVIEGRAEFGVGTSDLLELRHSGHDVVVLATIFQHSALAILTREFGPDSIHQLVGKKVAIEEHSAELFAYMKHEGLSPSNFTRVDHTFSVDDLINGRFDAMSIYTTTEPYLLAQQGERYHIMTPRSAGIDFYGDNLFTMRSTIENDPAMVRAFREASLRGWRYAMKEPELVVDWIISRYGSPMSKDALLFEASVMKALVDPNPGVLEIGFVNPGRWRAMADVYADLGLLPPDVDLTGFVYGYDEPVDLRWLYYTVGLGVTLVLVLGVAISLVSNANRRLRVSREHYRVMVDTAPMAIVVWNQHLQITGWNNAAEKIFGWRADEVMGKYFPDFILPEDARERVRELMIDLWRDRKPSHSVNPNLTRSGRRITCEWMNGVLLDADGNPEGALGLAMDVTERTRQETRLIQLAMQDDLTGLASRASFLEHLNRAFELVAAQHRSYALLYLDLDGFKQVNDQYGHEAGDAVLVESARRLQDALRRSDLIARLGGDEFTALVAEVGSEDLARGICDKILQRFIEPFQLENTRVEISISVGVALIPSQASSPEEALRHADEAMYAAKRQGKARAVLWDSSVEELGRSAIKSTDASRTSLRMDKYL